MSLTSGRGLALEADRFFGSRVCREEAEEETRTLSCRRGTGFPMAGSFRRNRTALPEGGRGQPPIRIERMLRVYLVRQWHSLLGEGVEDVIADSRVLRGFIGIGLSREAVPDVTKLLHFRQLLEEKDLRKQVFEAINARVAAQGLVMREGTIIDATILACCHR